MPAHDVTRELRDPHGRWTRTGAALHRMSREAEGAARGPATLEQVHEKVKAVAGMPQGKGQQVNKFSVHNMGDKGIRVRMPGQTQHYKDPREASVAVFRGQHHTEGHSPIPLPGGSQPGPQGPTPRPAPRPAPPQDVEDVFRRGVKSGQKTEVIHPKLLQINPSANQGADRNKVMRQKIIKASTIQGQHTPALVGKTEVTVTTAPHGKRGTSTLASHTGGHNTLHIKPGVLIGDNAQAILDNGRNQGWWVPTGKQHDLATNVMVHEYGHGLHGLLSKNGIILTNKGNPNATMAKEHEFWKGFAAAINKADPGSVQEPEVSDKPNTYGSYPMNVGQWLFRSQTNNAIRKHVSEYGSKNQNEMFAELWTEYVLSDSPRPLAKYFGDYVTKALGGKG